MTLESHSRPRSAYNREVMAAVSRGVFDPGTRLDNFEILRKGGVGQRGRCLEDKPRRALSHPGDKFSPKRFGVGDVMPSLYVRCGPRLETTE